MARRFQDCVVLLEVPNSLQARFGEVYRRSFDVLNRGFGGYNSSWVLSLMPYIFAKKEEANASPAVKLITVWLGTNDSTMSEVNSKHVPIPQFKQNINTILNNLTSESSPYAIAHSKDPLSIILITPPAIEDGMIDDLSHLNDARTKGYRDAVLDVGREWAEKEGNGDRWKLATIDLYGAIVKAGEQGGTSRFYNDGVHLTTPGYDVLWAEIEKLVQTDFKGRGINWNDQDDCPWTAPDWVHPAEHGPQRLLDMLVKHP